MVIQTPLTFTIIFPVPKHSPVALTAGGYNAIATDWFLDGPQDVAARGEGGGRMLEDGVIII